MELPRLHLPAGLTERISLGIAWMATVVGLTNFGDFYFVRAMTLPEALLAPNVSVEFLMAAFFGFARFLPARFVQLVQSGLILLLSGPMMLSNAYSFFGMWFFVLGTILVYKYGFLRRGAAWKLSLLFLYFTPFLLASVVANEGLASSITRVILYSTFLLFCLIFLYFIFEAEIRELLKNNGQKELALAARELEIARLEPLSVLGERVAHVAHSFKNNLAELHSIASILEDSGDARGGAQMLAQVTHRLDDRIENILMVSRAGVDLEPETFDAARVLEGMKFVYLSEPSVARSVWNEISLRGPVLIRAVRWDFILMVENILKNALDAINARGIRGTVRIDLTAGLLTISNNGGAMELCGSCMGKCLECSVYGQPGKTSKVGGSGHGLAQVFGTCRKNGWALRIRTDADWTLIQILLGDPRLVGAAPEPR